MDLSALTRGRAIAGALLLIASLFVAGRFLADAGSASEGGSSDGVKAFTTAQPYNPTLPNLVIYSQMVSTDTGRPGLPFSLSNGDRNQVPSLPTRITRIWVNDVNSATGSRSETYPYGLVTRFTHQ